MVRLHGKVQKVGNFSFHHSYPFALSPFMRHEIPFYKLLMDFYKINDFFYSLHTHTHSVAALAGIVNGVTSIIRSHTRRFGCDNFFTFHATRCVARSFQPIRFQNGLAVHLFVFWIEPRVRVCGSNEWACSYREIATTFDEERTLRKHLHIYIHGREQEKRGGLLQFYRRIIQAISWLGTEESSFDTYNVYELV